MNSCAIAQSFSYTPIIGSGNNANVLHYIENNQQCKSGDLILIDAGAEYANYSSDMTRTIPVSGKYNDRQKPFTMPFYALRMKLLKCLYPGTLWKQYHIEVGKLMTSELLGLGLLDKADVQNETQKACIQNISCTEHRTTWD
jgi:Xaa-Pro aminopeptidase